MPVVGCMEQGVEPQVVIIQPFLLYSQGIRDLGPKQITDLFTAFFVTVFDRPVYSISPSRDRRENVQQQRHRKGKPVFNLMRVSSRLFSLECLLETTRTHSLVLFDSHFPSSPTQPRLFLKIDHHEPHRCQRR